MGGRFALLLLLLLPHMALAAPWEYCDTVGAKGQIRWIYVPRTQYQTPPASFAQNRQEYNDSDRLFTIRGLPNVNDSVTLNHDTATTVLPECIGQNFCPREEFSRKLLISRVEKKEPYLFRGRKVAINTESYYCTYSDAGERGCWDLNRGASVKIMGYQTIDDVLYALVQVNDC